MYILTSPDCFSQLLFQWAPRSWLRTFPRSQNESGVLGLEIGSWTLVFSADVIMQHTEAARPGKGGNSENIPFQ